MANQKLALVSVSDKAGVVDFCRDLTEVGFTLLFTGGTARALREGGLKVTDVSEFTESPEVMDGRVKTLHPRIHGGILMRDNGKDLAELESLGGSPIELVCVNLYPFEQTVARGAGHQETIENIDIGGPSMVRSAAKNHARVAIVTDPGDYSRVAASYRDSGSVGLELRAELAAKAFTLTAAYDGAIATYLTSQRDEESAQYPGTLSLQFQKAYDLRYGENPHQSGAFYIERGALPGCLASAELLGAGGKQLSFNNLVDVDAALDCVREFSAPAAVVVKHTNPCGVARADNLALAYERARAADSQSAFGGIVALNRAVDLATASLIRETFIECVVAPSFSAEALEVLSKKKNLRLLATGEWLEADHKALVWKRISGGIVVQDRDATAGVEVSEGRVVTARAPSEEERRSLDFAWRVCKHVKSNAIVFAKDDQTVGVGAGQMARVVSVGIAARKAGELSQGASMASDAFFPFADAVEAAAEAGITAIAQPGGSKRDEEVIAAADAAGIAMVMTGFRHFRH